MDAHDIRFMQRALALAHVSTGLASPNPLVGCVLVRQGQVVGEGFHQFDGRDHAEVVALKIAGERAVGATMYVTLEPCNHTGRTGPCTEAIISAGVRRVVAAMRDPNPTVHGAGFERLRAADIEVVTDFCEDEARRLNEGFTCWITRKRPFVTLKAALTLDGQMALPQISSGRGGGRKKKSTRHQGSPWITSEESRAEVHRMRHAADALITGIGTILADDPLLTDRAGLPRRRLLLRVVLDSKLRLPVTSRIVKTADDDLLVFTAASLQSAKARKLQKAGVEIVRARTWQGRIDLGWALEELGRRQILGALLECGSNLNGAALGANIVDKVFLFYAPKIAGKISVPFAVSAHLKHAPLQGVRVLQFGPDFAIEGYLHDVHGK
ncbi:MAG: bifunctional diaminohydroxyphosphoribosylaminopyrimidine deaminase/5-amino-6-(5-phosphoribosylamino)uracil reductase RibD [Candidatus Acidiferrum sp.]